MVRISHLPSESHRDCMCHGADVARKFVLLRRANFEDDDWLKKVKGEQLNYVGEMIKRPECLTWLQIEAAKSSADPYERGRAEESAEGAMKTFPQTPEVWISMAPKLGKMFSRPADMEEIATGLIRYSVVDFVEQSEVVHIKGEPLRSSWFGVGRGEHLPGSQEALCLVMNMSTNDIFDPLDGECTAVSVFTQLRYIVVLHHECLLLSSVDLRSLFYLFSLRPGWSRLFVFDALLAGRQCGLNHDRVGYVASKVICVGWRLAVMVAQYLMRKLHLGASPICCGLGKQGEVRRDRPFPSVHSPENAYSWWKHMDNGDEDEVVLRELVKAFEGTRSSSRQHLRESLKKKRCASSESKALERRPNGKRLGAQVNGDIGWDFPHKQRVFELIGMWRALMQGPQVNTHDLQVVICFWVFGVLLRRECLNAMDAGCSEMLERMNGSRLREARGPRAVFEHSLLICALPLLHSDVRPNIDPTVTCSDASECEGGVCSSNSVSNEKLLELCRLAQATDGAPSDALDMFEVGPGFTAPRRAHELQDWPLKAH